MNSIERVENVLKGNTVDRVPLGFYLVDCDTIEKVIGRQTYVRNNIARQIAFWEGRRDEVAESYKKDTVDFFRKVELCDIITAKEAAVLPPKDYEPPKVRKIADDKYEDEEGRIFKISKLSNEFVCVEDPVAKRQEYSIEDFPPDPEIKPLDESIFEAFDFMSEQMSGDRFILGPGSLGAMVLLGGMEKGLMEYVMRPELVRAITKHNLSINNAHTKQMIRKGQRGVLFEQDYGTTRASLMSPEMFREFCFPAMKSRTETIKSFGQHVFSHSCGYTWELLDMFIEAGIECYQSLQTDAGMDIAKLHERFGNKIVFWGGIAVETLLTGSMDDVRANVREAVSKAKLANAIIGPSHSIAYGTPYDNFMAMLDEFNKCASY